MTAPTRRSARWRDPRSTSRSTTRSRASPTGGCWPTASTSRYGTRSARAGLAVLFVDLDHFGDVNLRGHSSGDRLIVDAARALEACVRETDTVARLGSDEFVIVLGPLDDHGVVERVVGAVRERIAAIEVGGRADGVTASVGVASFPRDGATSAELLQSADHSLTQAKAAGRDRVCYFDAAQHAESVRRQAIARDLQGALDRGEFTVVYQPIVHLRTGTISKAEALLRWSHPTHGAVSPAVFIPIAEMSGAICEIGDWVFRTAAEQVKRWRAAHDARFQVSVNCSPVQFRNDDSAAPSWNRHLTVLGLPGDAIALEVTEGLLLEPGLATQEHLAALRANGVCLSLDDFGTGYSSLSYLQQFEVDVVKIDRSFVHGLAPRSKQALLCEGIIAMAHALGLTVVAEGVETEAQRTILSELGCDYAQGYLLGRPMPVEQLEAILQTSPPLPPAAAS